MGSQSGVYYRIQRSYVLIDQILTSNLKAAKIDHVLPALTFLDTCLRDVLALIIKRVKKRTAVYSCPWMRSWASLPRSGRKLRVQRIL